MQSANLSVAADKVVSRFIGAQSFGTYCGGTACTNLLFWFAEVHPVVALTPQEGLEDPASEVAHQGMSSLIT